MSGTTPPSPPLQLPEAIRAWARGRPDRAVSVGARGTTTLTRFEPGEVLQARFASAAEAAAALAGEVRWEPVTREPSRWRGRNS